MAKRKILLFLIFLLFLIINSEWAEDFKEKDYFMVINGAKIYYDDGGSGGIPIVFVHGLGGDHTLFKYQLDYFRKSRRTIAVDLYGHYKSTALRESDYSIEFMAKTLIKLLTKLKIEKFVLAGHSMGSAVILEVSRQAPERVLALIFIDPAGDVYRLPKEKKTKMIDSLKAKDYKNFIKEWFSAMLASAKEETKEKVFLALERVSQETLVGEYRALTEYEVFNALQNFSGPMLSVNRPKSVGNLSYHKLVPKIESISLEGVSHYLMMDEPDKLNQIIDDFLKKR